MRNYTLIVFTLVLLILFIGEVKAQELSKLSGKVINFKTGESIVGATVYLKEKQAIGTVTDVTGMFELVAPTGPYTIVLKSIGFETKELKTEFAGTRSATFKLTPVQYEVQEVEIIGSRKLPLSESVAMGQLDLPMETIKSLPILLGESDIIKTIQLMPGVKSGGEGNTGFYVRGGGADQNLILLDKATIYNPGHLFNFFSVFNSDAVRNATLIKGNMPARYGGRLSSVLDVEMKEGSQNEYRANGGIGLIASRFSAQGPIVDERAAFILSGRRTYIDKIAEPFFKNSEQGGVPYYFYDLNGKISYHISDKDRIYLSGYHGKDVGAFTLSEGRFVSDFSWGNTSASLHWNHLFNDRLFLNATAMYSGYDFDFNWNYGGFNTLVQTGIKDYSFNLGFDYTPNVRHHFEYGLQYTNHELRPRAGQSESTEGEQFRTNRVKTKYAHEIAFYVSDEWNLTDKILINLGLRSSNFLQVGPFSYYTFGDNEQVTDSIKYNKGRLVKAFHNLEPRIALRYELNKSSSIKAAYSNSAQYLHLVSNAYTTLPLDVWVPSSAIINPQSASQFALGYFRGILNNEFEASLEIYYKAMKNQLEYREGFAPGPSNRDLEYEFVSGKGTSYGIELFIRKNFGNLQGWLGYTLSRSTRRFPNLNEGRSFPARFDSRHDLSLVASYKLNDRWTLGSNFIYITGQATTLPVRLYAIEGAVVYQYGDRNSFRMEATHRLDLSATLESKKREKMESSWTFSVYNVYGRRNPFLYYIDNEGLVYNQNAKLQAKKVSIIPFPLPSVTWNFTWK